jgi:protein-arginine kinase activator protein McsA
MPYKDPKVKKAKGAGYSKKYYEANKAKALLANAATRKKKRTEFKNWKATLSCSQCGFSHVAALDFHHIDAKSKDGIVSELVRMGRFKKAKAEAEKCIVLCANCHRVHHYEEKKNKKI